MHSLSVLFHISVLVASELQGAMCTYDELQYGDFCPNKNNNHCDNPKDHIVCQLQDGMVEACGRIEALDLQAEHVERLLSSLNKLRIDAAAGHAKLPKGYGLMRLKWDRELAGLARLQIGVCYPDYLSSCASTEKFWQPQMLHIDGTLTDDLTIVEEFEQKIKDARKETDPQAIRKCPELTDIASSSNYLMLVHGALTHIGCSFGRFNEYYVTNYENYYVVCYISHQLPVGKPVYDLISGSVANGYSGKCGCPPNSTEVEGCLCDILDQPTTNSTIITTLSTQPIFAEPVYLNKRIRGPTEPAEPMAGLGRTLRTARTIRTLSTGRTRRTPSTGRTPPTARIPHTGRTPRTARTARTRRTLSTGRAPPKARAPHTRRTARTRRTPSTGRTPHTTGV